MFTSFSTALSALSAHATAIDVVGNNLANLNTPGFKTNVVSFHDLVTQSLGAGLGETQVGFGVGAPTTLRQFSQGAIQTTSGPLDAAIQGDGFFVVKADSGQIEYSRGGNFQVDQNGNLMTATGEKVQGWSENGGSIDTNAPIGDITVPVGTVKPPVATSEFSLDVNLNANATAGPPPTTFSRSIEVYDSLGVSHILNVQFVKNAAQGQWDFTVTIPAADATTIVPATGSITFGPDGKLTAPLQGDDMPVMQADGFADGAGPMSVKWNIYNGQTPRLTQFAQPSDISANEQNGAPPAQLVRVGIADGGQILAQYDNGQQEVVGQLAMATIRNPESLISVGNNNYELSARTSLPAIGVPGTGGRGSVIGGAVESSTVDIAREFTNLIVYQRGYQANSKVVTTVDQLSQDTINLKQ